MNQQNKENPENQVLSTDAQPMSRRKFMQTGVLCTGGITALFMGGAGARFVAGDAFEPTANQWIKVAPLESIRDGQVERISYSVSRQDAWRKTEQKGLLYVITDAEGSATVLDATCSHLGCTVRWNESDDTFVCPCHNAMFGRSGEVVTGPPPRPLTQLNTKIEDGSLWAEV